MRPFTLEPQMDTLLDQLKNWDDYTDAGKKKLLPKLSEQ